MIDSTLTDLYGVDAVSRFSGKEADLPITTLSTETSQSYFTNSYPKSAMGYLYVKDLLGDELFTKALHTYINNWKGKHPIPQDFFNSMNAGSGKNLNWFWKAWFMSDGVPDLGIGKVTLSTKPTVEIIAKGTKPLPIDLTLKFADSSTQLLHRSIAVWEKGNTRVVLPLPAGKKIVKMNLGSAHVPDGNKEDNSWTPQPAK
jgi:aminopeptidase N